MPTIRPSADLRNMKGFDVELFSKKRSLVNYIKDYKLFTPEENPKHQQDDDSRRILRDFASIREEKEKELRVKIKKAYRNVSLIYMFDEHMTDADSFTGTISELQRKLIKNIYTKRLASRY